MGNLFAYQEAVVRVHFEQIKAREARSSAQVAYRVNLAPISRVNRAVECGVLELLSRSVDLRERSSVHKSRLILKLVNQVTWKFQVEIQVNAGGKPSYLGGYVVSELKWNVEDGKEHNQDNHIDAYGQAQIHKECDEAS